MPCCLSFGAVILLQLQAKLGALGATSIFPIALVASGCRMPAFRTMVSGVPGYALGMALGYTPMSRMHSLQSSGRVLSGRPMLRMVWRGELAAQKELSST